MFTLSYGNLTDGATHRPFEETDCNRSRWGRVIAVKIFKTRPKSFPWSENLIRVVKAIRDSSSAIPIPYIQPAAAIVVNILEVVQSAHRNEADLKELATGLVDIIETIQSTLAAHGDGYDAPTSYLCQCDEFIHMLSAMSNELNHVMHKHKSWTRFFRTTEIQDKITYWRRQVENRRNNFTLMTVMNIMCALPRELGYTWERSKPLRFVDAMNITIDLPIALCSSQDDFHNLLLFIFRKRRGRYFVDQGLYDLTTGQSDRTAPTILTAAQWPSLVKPGSSIDMNIVLWQNGLDAGDGRQCPTCKRLCSGASLGEEVTCPSCQTMFRVSRGIIEEIAERTESPCRPLEVPSTSTRASDSASSGSENLATSKGVEKQTDNEALDIQYFRRFHVIMDTLDRTKPLESDTEGSSHLSPHTSHHLGSAKVVEAGGATDASGHVELDSLHADHLPVPSPSTNDNVSSLEVSSSSSARRISRASTDNNPDPQFEAKKYVYRILTESNSKDKAFAKVVELTHKLKSNLIRSVFDDASQRRVKFTPAGQRRSRPLTFFCILCEGQFTTNWNLQNHYRSHLRMNQYHCPGCGDFFRTEGIRRRHMNSAQKCCDLDDSPAASRTGRISIPTMEQTPLGNFSPSSFNYSFPNYEDDSQLVNAMKLLSLERLDIAFANFHASDEWANGVNKSTVAHDGFVTSGSESLGPFYSDIGITVEPVDPVDTPTYAMGGIPSFPYTPADTFPNVGQTHPDFYHSDLTNSASGFCTGSNEAFMSSGLAERPNSFTRSFSQRGRQPFRRDSRPPNMHILRRQPWSTGPHKESYLNEHFDWPLPPNSPSTLESRRKRPGSFRTHPAASVSRQAHTAPDTTI